MGQPQSRPKYKNLLIWAIAGLLLVISVVAIGSFWGHKDSGNRHFISRSHKLINVDQFYDVVGMSKNKTNHAIKLLKQGDFQQAKNELIDAINICPINTDAYQLLAQIYLLAGKELRTYYVFDRAGDSYADLNKVIKSVDDADLDKIPLDEPQDNIFLARFPENKKMAISFMFDDGETNIYDHLSIFEKYGFRDYSVVAGFVGTAPYWGTWKKWKDSSNRGFGSPTIQCTIEISPNLSRMTLTSEIDQADS